MHRKYKTILIALIITIVIITCLCVVLILIKDKGKEQNDISNISNKENIIIELQQVEDLNTMYNIEEDINNALDENSGLSFEEDDDYDEENDSYNIEPTQNTTNKFLKELDIPYGIFYINDLYKIEPNDKYAIYFVSGDIRYINSEDEDEEKNNVIFTLTKDKETNYYGIEFYKTNYENIFNYTDNIADITFEQSKLKNFKPAYELELYANDEYLSDDELGEWMEYKID